MKNKVITSQGNVQFIFPDGKVVNVHPNHIYTAFNEDTVSFILVALPKSSGLALMTSKAEDLELNGETYSFAELPAAMSEAFAIAGAQARCEIVDELPETGYTNTIYLVPQPAPQTGFDEYVYVDGQWELIGDTSIEMENYVTKTVFSGYTASTAAELSGKAEVVEITQANYDLLPSSAKTDASKLYVISDAQPIDLSIYAKTSAVTSADTALDNKIDAVSGATDAALALKQNILTAGTGIDITSDVISVTGSTGGITSGEVQTMIDSSISGKANSSDVYLKNETSGATEISTAINAVSGDVETETSRAEGVENVLSGAIDTIDAKFIDDAKYEDSGNTKVINFYNGNTIKATIDCSDFIVDGMVDDVRIENGYLVIDFNTASGKQDIQIPLTDIFNPSNYYTKSETSGATEISDALNAKQNTLVSAQNIKTINNESILGSGNIDIQGGGGKAIEAGRGISVTTGETADTVSFDLPISATTDGSILIGVSCSANRDKSFVGGYGSVGQGEGSFAFGQNCKSSQWSIAVGDHIEANVIPAASAFGKYNKQNGGYFEPESATTLFSVGNGSTNNARHNAFEIRQNGDIYIQSGNTDIKLQDYLGAGGGTVDTALDSGSTNPVENRVIYNKIDEIEEVTSAGLNAVNDKFDGLKLKKISQTDYDNLQVKDQNTLYIVI